MEVEIASGPKCTYCKDMILDEIKMVLSHKQEEMRRCSHKFGVVTVKKLPPLSPKKIITSKSCIKCGFVEVKTKLTKPNRSQFQWRISTESSLSRMMAIRMRCPVCKRTFHVEYPEAEE